MKAPRKIHRITLNEEKKIKEIVDTVGEPYCWKFLVAVLELPMRNIREHYRDYIQANQAPFSIHEDKLIFDLLAEGLSFHKMIPYFSNRTRIQLRNRYNKIERQKSKQNSVFRPISDAQIILFEEFTFEENFSSDQTSALPFEDETPDGFFGDDFN
jgi:hypothetical protein